MRFSHKNQALTEQHTVIRNVNKQMSEINSVTGLQSTMSCQLWQYDYIYIEIALPEPFI